MEKDIEQIQSGVTISRREAEEYCAYKRQKKISEITSAMRRSESLLERGESGVRTCERASRLRQISVRMTPTDILQKGEIFKKSPVKIDCIIGGNGETFAKVKAYEAKRAVRAGAKELTLILSPSLIENGRYSELRKELKKVKRAAGRIPLKARIERTYPQATMSRLARLCAELGAYYFSVPYFEGCPRLKVDLSLGCLLEVSGVENLADFRKMIGAGIGRIVTSHAWEIYEEWLKEAEKVGLEQGKPLSTPTMEKPPKKEAEAGEKPLPSQEAEGTAAKVETGAGQPSRTAPNVAVVASAAVAQAPTQKPLFLPAHSTGARQTK